MTEATSGPGVDLYWLPLGAGGRSVRLNGRVYERVVAWLERREASTSTTLHSVSSCRRAAS